MDVVPPGFQELHRSGTAGWNHNVLADTDSIAGKSNRFLFGHRKPLFLGYPLRDGGQAIGIEGGRKVQQFSTAQRTKAGIQVVEPAIDEFEGNDFTLEDFAELRKRPDVRSLVIPPEPRIRKS